MDNHRQVPWHAEKLTEVYQKLHTSEKGLSDAEAAERLRKNGRNELRSKPPKTILQMLKAQISDPMVLILIGAALFFSSAAGMDGRSGDLYNRYRQCGHRYRAGEKAQSSLEALRNMSSPAARVLRQGGGEYRTFRRAGDRRYRYAQRRRYGSGRSASD